MPTLFVAGTAGALVFAGIGVIAAIFLFIGAAVSIWARFNPDFEIKNMTDGQVAKMIKQIERIKERFPEKLPKVLESTLPPAANQ